MTQKILFPNSFIPISVKMQSALNEYFCLKVIEKAGVYEKLLYSCCDELSAKKP